MAFNGSGTFVRLYDWTDDRDAEIPITASRFDSEDDGFATGLSTCITKDGQTTITANLPMSGFKHTGVGDANARDDYAVVGQMQDNSYSFAVGAGTANAQTVTLAPAVTAYADGMVISFEAGATNTGNTTLNVNSVGAQSVVLPNGDELPAGAITSGRFYTAIYDLTNTKWILIAGASVLSSLSVISANTTSNVIPIVADSVTTANVIDITADALTTGGIFSFVSDSSNTGTRSLGFIHNDNTAATGTTVLSLQQDAAQRALFIDQNGNDVSIEIDSESTTSDVLSINADSTTIGRAILVSADGLTAGGMMLLESNSSSSSTRNLAVINNINASATGANVLLLTQAANAGTLQITSSSTTSDVANIDADSLTTGSGFAVKSNSSNTSNRDILLAHNDNASATGAQALHALQDSTGPACRMSATNASYTGQILRVVSDKAANSNFNFAKFYSSDLADTEFTFRGDGEAFADGSFTGGGADYAEYIEWADGNPTNEDRRGVVVELVGDKIQEATNPADAYGVISGNPSVVGDAAWNKWNKKHLTDDFGSYILEDYEIWQWTVKNEEGIEEGMVYEADNIPDYIKVPRNKEVIIQKRRKLNPEFDPDMEYIPRAERKEWGCVGLVGKLRIRKGQLINPSWRKMKDISDEVEEWMIK